MHMSFIYLEIAQNQRCLKKSVGHEMQVWYMCIFIQNIRDDLSQFTNSRFSFREQEDAFQPAHIGFVGAAPKVQRSCLPRANSLIYGVALGSFRLQCIMLHFTLLYFTLLYFTLLYFTVLYCTVLHCTALGPQFGLSTDL